MDRTVNRLTFGPTCTFEAVINGFLQLIITFKNVNWLSDASF